VAMRSDAPENVKVFSCAATPASSVASTNMPRGALRIEGMKQGYDPHYSTQSKRTIAPLRAVAVPVAAWLPETATCPTATAANGATIWCSTRLLVTRPRLFADWSSATACANRLAPFMPALTGPPRLVAALPVASVAIGKSAVQSQYTVHAPDGALSEPGSTNG